MTLKTGYIQVDLVDYKKQLYSLLDQLEAAAEEAEQKESARQAEEVEHLAVVRAIYRRVFDLVWNDYQNRAKSLLRVKANPPVLNSDRIYLRIDERQFRELKSTIETELAAVDHTHARFEDMVELSYQPRRWRMPDQYREDKISRIKNEINYYPNTGKIELTLQECHDLGFDDEGYEIIYR